MKLFRFLSVFVISAFTLWACSSDEPENGGKNNDEEHDEVWYAQNATVGSDSSYYVAVDGGGMVNFDAGSGSVVIDVSCGTSWKVSNTATDWLTTSVSSSSVTLTAAENTTANSRSATVKLLTSTSGIEFASLTVTQFGAEEPEVDTSSLVLVYSTSAGGTTIALPLAGTVDCTVDWGDGTVETFTGEISGSDDLISHTYSKTGELTVQISGTVTALNSINVDSSSSDALTRVERWGDTGLESMDCAFYYCRNLESVPDDTEGSFSRVTDFSYAFEWCSSLTSVPEGLFAHCTEVTDFSYVFHRCTGLTSIPSNLFAGCPKVTTFYYTFGYCNVLESIPAGLFDNCTEVNDFTQVLNGCSALPSIPSGLFDKNTKVTSFYYAIGDCGLEIIPDGLFDNCPLVIDFKGVFNGCESITSIPSGLFDNCSAATDFAESFEGCTALESIPASLFDNNRKVTDFSEAFYYCEKLTGESPYTEISVDGERVKVHLYERQDYPDCFDVSDPLGNSCFYNCTGLDDYEDMPSSWVDLASWW